MKVHPRIPILLFYGLIVLMVAVSFTSFVEAISWIDKPFAGFLIYHPPYVGSMSIADWPGRQSGLKFLDRVVSIDGEPVIRGRDVVSRIEKREPGTLVHYVIKSKGMTRDVILPVTLFGLRDFFLTFFINLLGGLAVFCLGCIVYVLKPRLSTSWVFFVFSFFLGLYMITSFEILSTYVFIHLHYFAACFMGITALHLGLIFPDRKPFLLRFPEIEYLIYALPLALAVIYQIYFFTFSESMSSNLGELAYRFLGTTARLITFSSAIGLIPLMIYSLYRASSVTARQRARMILFGATIAFLPSTGIMMAFYLFKVAFPWNFLVIFVIFFPASIAYSIVRHNLFDADMIIRRTVGYVVVTAVVVGTYIGVSLGLNVLLGSYQLAQSRAFPILFTIGIILIFNPLRDRLQVLVDRLFFRKEYDYGAIVEKVGGAMTSLLELSPILKRLVQTFTEDMFINSSSVMLLAPAESEFHIIFAEGEQKQIVEKVSLKQDEPLMEIIRREKRELTKYDVLEDPRYREVSESCATDFARLNASLIVPLIYQNHVIGSLNLGEKKSGKAYNREDLDLLRAIASQGSVAIENARLFQENLEKQRMEEELNIARDLQMSMLPSVFPRIKGFDVAATSIPAREVGGDFYDFIEMGKDRLGLVVGDVTGKSVSGALVMAASRSVFRILSEERLTVGEIMIRANWRMKKDIKKGMFVALLYAVLNSNDRVLSFCSAGQTHPMLFSAETSKAVLLETKGDNFPLGILEESDYQETQVVLKPGDRVIFYTDGIVEAMNEKKEIFGFDRLLDVLQNAGPISADELLKDILSQVKHFTGNAPQHDDLTVIAVSVEG